MEVLYPHHVLSAIKFLRQYLADRITFTADSVNISTFMGPTNR